MADDSLSSLGASFTSLDSSESESESASSNSEFSLDVSNILEDKGQAAGEKNRRRPGRRSGRYSSHNQQASNNNQQANNSQNPNTGRNGHNYSLPSPSPFQRSPASASAGCASSSSGNRWDMGRTHSSESSPFTPQRKRSFLCHAQRPILIVTKKEPQRKGLPSNLDGNDDDDDESSMSGDELGESVASRAASAVAATTVDADGDDQSIKLHSLSRWSSHSPANARTTRGAGSCHTKNTAPASLQNSTNNNRWQDSLTNHSSHHGLMNTSHSNNNASFETSVGGMSYNTGWSSSIDTSTFMEQLSMRRRIPRRQPRKEAADNAAAGDQQPIQVQKSTSTRSQEEEEKRDGVIICTCTSTASGAVDVSRNDAPKDALTNITAASTHAPEANKDDKTAEQQEACGCSDATTTGEATNTTSCAATPPVAMMTNAPRPRARLPHRQKSFGGGLSIGMAAKVVAAEAGSGTSTKALAAARGRLGASGILVKQRSEPRLISVEEDNKHMYDDSEYSTGSVLMESSEQEKGRDFQRRIPQRQGSDLSASMKDASMLTQNHSRTPRSQRRGAPRRQLSTPLLGRTLSKTNLLGDDSQIENDLKVSGDVSGNAQNLPEQNPRRQVDESIVELPSTSHLRRSSAFDNDISLSIIGSIKNNDSLIDASKNSNQDELSLMDCSGESLHSLLNGQRSRSFTCLSASSFPKCPITGNGFPQRPPQYPIRQKSIELSCPPPPRQPQRVPSSDVTIPPSMRKMMMTTNKDSSMPIWPLRQTPKLPKRMPSGDLVLSSSCSSLKTMNTMWQHDSSLPKSALLAESQRQQRLPPLKLPQRMPSGDLILPASSSSVRPITPHQKHSLQLPQRIPSDLSSERPRPQRTVTTP
mgnify:CR=1 FL=1